MAEQQLHSIPQQHQPLTYCADCILHLDHHEVREECIDAILKVAEEWRNGDMTILSFQDYYNARYEQEVLLQVTIDAE